MSIDNLSAQVLNLKGALSLCRRSFVAVFVFSFATNLLMLTPMFYMINVFDKAVGTGSFPTLISLVVIAVFLYIVLAVMEWTRSRVLVFVSMRLDRLLAPRMYDICFASESGAFTAQGVGSQPLTDLNSLRQFITGGSVMALFDLPWLPFYLVVMLLFHPALALVAVVCMAIMLLLALANQRATTEQLEQANDANRKIAGQTQRNLRNAEVVVAMGMTSALTRSWRTQQDAMLNLQEKASNTAGAYSATIKTMATAMQSAAITTGAVLAMQQQISPGVMIGAALLLGRSLAPIQQAVTGWKGFADAQQQYGRLNELLTTFPPAEDSMPLPPIVGGVSAQKVAVVPPGGKNATLFDVSFSIAPGTTVMVLGASGAGKSTLVRCILGLWPTAQGEMRIDGAEAAHYDRDLIGPQIGYLPQDIELFDGTVAQNIARFGAVDPDLVVKAASDAEVHEMILALPDGYDSIIGTQGGLLSPGQRQRIALARALYDRPPLVVLDEPNSNLDEAGERALNNAMKTLKSVGSTIVLVSHRQGALPLADYLLVLEAGRIKEQGPTGEVITRIKQAMAERQATEQQVAQAPTTVERQDA